MSGNRVGSWCRNAALLWACALPCAAIAQADPAVPPQSKKSSAAVATPLSDRVRGDVALDNSGIRIFSRSQLATNLALPNPSGLNDLITVSVSSRLDALNATRRSQRAGLSYHIPWGRNTLQLSGGHDRFAQRVPGTAVQFLASGQSQTGEARLRRTVWRSGASRLGAHAAISTRRVESFTEGVRPSGRRRRTTILSAGVALKHLFARSALELTLACKRELPWGGAQDDLPDAASGVSLRPRIWNLGATFTGPLRDATPARAQPINFASSVRVQYTGRRALVIDQMAIGGRNGVRGFDGDSVLLAENGLIWRNEFTTPVAIPKLPVAAAYLAQDFGSVWGPSSGALAGRSLAGVAMGFRGRSGAFAYDLGLGTPLYHPEGFHTRRVSLYTNLTFAF